MKFTVLLVEDDDFSARTVTRAFQDPPDGFEFDVKRVKTLKDAVSNIAQGEYDTVLLDLFLEDSTPQQTLQAAIEKSWGDKVTLVIMTGYNADGIEELAQRAGASLFLNKTDINLPRLASTLIREHAHHTLKNLDDCFSKFSACVETTRASLQRIAG